VRRSLEVVTILHQGNGTDKLDLASIIYLEQVFRDLDDAVAICNVEINAEHGIEIMTDRAIPIALITAELITNATKHAHAGGPNGPACSSPAGATILI
jgi:two-component sensor histidine kinase